MKKFILHLNLITFLIFSSNSGFAQIQEPPEYLRAQKFTFNTGDNSWTLDKIINIVLADSLPVSSYEYSVNAGTDSLVAAMQTYSYDNSKNLIAYTNSSYNYETQSWDLENEADYKYLNNVLVNEISHSGDIYIQKASFVDSQSSLINISFKMQSYSAQGPWDTLNKFTLNYDDQNRLTQTQVFNYDTSGKSYYLRYEYDYSYNDGDSVTEYNEYKIENSEKINLYKATFEYNSDNLLTGMKYYIPDGDSWLMYYNEAYQYYSDRKIKSMNSTAYSDTSSAVQTDGKYYVYGNSIKTVFDTLRTGSDYLLTRMDYNYPKIESDVNLQAANTKFILFPNPAVAGDNITISLPEFADGAAKLSITDIQGETVYSAKFEIVNNKISFPTPNLPAGFYFVQIIDKEQSLSFAKLILKN